MPSKTTVDRRPGRGRCMIAAKNLGLGELIMAVQPLSAVLDQDHARAHCASCFQAIVVQHGSGVGSRCSRCKRIWYCSRKCQKTDWREHAQECRVWSSTESGRTPTRTLRLAARILNSINRGGGGAGTGDDRGGNNSTAREAREAIDELVDHNGERSPEQREEYMLMAAFVARLCVAGSGGDRGDKTESSTGPAAVSWPSAKGRGFAGLVDAAFAVLGKLSCNVFSVAGGADGGIIGCGLYLEAATANHSCRPNASQSFDGKTLSLRCTRPIRRGEEITIAITPIHMPGPLRRQSLRTSYFFECRCERCESPSGRAADDRLEAYACLDRNCSGICLLPTTHGGTLGDGSGSGGCVHQGDTPPLPQSDHAKAQKGERPGPEDASNIHREGEDERSLDLACADALQSKALVGAQEREKRGCRVLTCGTCGKVSRRVEDAQNESKGIDELLKRGKAFEQAGEMLEARRCLEQSLGRAEKCLHRGNWVLSELYTSLATVCVGLQDFDAASEHATKGIDSSRDSLAALLPNFEPWGHSLAFAGKLLLCIRQQPEKAMALLLEAESCFKVTHGVGHSRYASIRDLLDQARLSC